MTDKEHAEHNEKVFKYLKKKKEFADWAVIAAFYSALHYIDHKIFPINKRIAGQKTTFPSIDSYFVHDNSANSKHGLRIKLLREKGLGIHSHYKWLFEERKTKQYHNHEIPNPDNYLQAVDRNFEAIKKACK